MPSPKDNSALIKQIAAKTGFAFCGISKADFLEKEAPKLEKWLSLGYNAEMKYLENYFDMRLDPRILMPGAKTVVSLLFNYYPEKKQKPDSYKIAKYAYGKDYHFVVKDKCRQVLDELRTLIGDFDARAFVDSAPILERTWAEKSGLGWIGKHGLLINKQKGSFLFLAELIIDIECEADGPIKDYCGTCTKCIDACPTEAILPEKTLDASKCISYLTIELKNEIPSEFSSKMEDWIFGCDICQDVCPWNRFSESHSEPEFSSNTDLLDLKKEDWENLNETTFSSLFKSSAVKRTGFKGLSRNIRFLKPK